MATISVDRKACIRCGACVDVCFVAEVFELTDKGSSPVRPEDCWGCGQCVAVCPTDAIDHDGFPLEECPIIGEKDVPTLDGLTTAYRVRRSCRTFEEKAVPREVIRDLVTLGRWAPTASNSQSLDWVAFDDRDKIAELSDTILGEFRRFAGLVGNPVLRPFISLAIGRETTHRMRGAKASTDRLLRRRDAGEDPIFYHAPVVLLGHSPAGNTLGRDDAIYAAYNMMLAAGHFGLGTCQIGLFQIVFEKSGRLRRKVTLPEGRTSQVALAAGYLRYPFRRALPRRSPNLTWNPR
jgi:nitroreductase/NAD-dependent dihydropyrimidine dehydrogenase PreA subunit